MLCRAGHDPGGIPGNDNLPLGCWGQTLMGSMGAWESPGYCPVCHFLTEGGGESHRPFWVYICHREKGDTHFHLLHQELCLMR